MDNYEAMKVLEAMRGGKDALYRTELGNGLEITNPYMLGLHESVVALDWVIIYLGETDDTN